MDTWEESFAAATVATITVIIIYGVIVGVDYLIRLVS